MARKPIVQCVAEELIANKIDQILFITGRNKTSIENHFDHDPELFRALTETNKHDLIQELGFEDLKANFFYTRQRLQRGLGDAILCGENFAGEEPFLVALGDSILGLHATSMAVTRMASSTASLSDTHAFHPIDTWSSWPALVEMVSHDAGAAWPRSRFTSAAAV